MRKKREKKIKSLGISDMIIIVVQNYNFYYYFFFSINIFDDRLQSGAYKNEKNFLYYVKCP